MFIQVQVLHNNKNNKQQQYLYGTTTESLINYHYSEADKDSLASYTIGMEVGDWSNAGRKSGLFSVHPAVTSDYIWKIDGSP